VRNDPILLFENAEFLVVGKPSGWLSIPAREPKPEDAVLSHWLRTISPEVRVVHRLDRHTSGVMLFAKTETAHKDANRWFEKREVKKVYQFLAMPPPTRPAIQIKLPVDGKAAQTLFEIIEKTDGVFLGKATPLTGRFHQIREHAMSAKFPLLGDKAYGGAMKVKIGPEEIAIPRVCLHAASLELPFGLYEMPLPEDLQNLWRRFKNA
jgi:23S rRNA-/tRNA-specific pseudouridylate synthase